MERALLREMEELERTIGELTRRKARKAGAITSPEWQIPAMRVSRRPDGFSGRQEDPASVSRDGTLARPTMQLKLPRFNGTASLESYLAQLELAAQLASWTPEQTAGHLALALEGPALEAILDLPPAERQNLQALTAALQRRFTQHRSAEASREKLLSRYRCEEESWGKVAADVQRYAREAYPEFDAAAQEKLALHAFLRALTPERLRDHVSLAQPGSISEALSMTTRAEDTLAIRPTPQPTRQHVRVADGEEVCWTRTPLQRPARRQGRCYRCDEPGHIARDCPAPAPKPRKPPPSGNEAGTAHTALPAQVAKIPATSLEASTSAFTKAAEHKSHPRVGRLGKASGLYLHCWLDGQACRALVDTGATISLVRPGVLHNTGGPQLPGAWTPTATPLTSVTGAKMAMRGKKEVKVTVTGQEVSHEFWLADIADSCIIGLDLLKRWGACVDVSRGSITLGTETVALQSGPTRKPARRARHLATTARRARHLATTARPASKLLQLATAPKPPSLTAVPQPDHSLAHHHQPVPQQPPAQPKPALPAETTAAVHALWQRSSSGLDHQQRQQLKSLLDGNADLFAVRDEDCTQTELVQHTINTDTAQPIRLRPHRMSPAKRLVAEEKVKEMAAAGVIEPSDSPWAAPAVLVQKKSGEWRFCVDYRRLNFLTTKDSYPLPRIDEALDHISGSSWFSSLDLRSGYWQEEQSMAFDQLRAALTEAPVLAYPDAKRPFIVDTDASNTGVGAVLSQEDEDGERVVAYYSRALGKAERNYCVTRRELLAVVRALHHFRPYLQGSHFLLRTDHASLTWLLTFKDPEGQVARWLEQLQGYDFEIRHRAGRLHGNADALSRRPCAAQECRYCSRQEERDQVSPDVAVVQASGDAEGWLPLTPMELREAQEADSTLGKVRSWLEAGQRPERSVVSAESPEVKSYYSLYSSLVQRDGLLYRRWEAPGRGSDILQLLVPRALRPDVLRLVHGSVGAGHFGNNKTLHRLRGKFHWPGCRHDVELHVQCCDSCTAQKGPSQRSRAPLQQHLVGAPMERVGVDVLGPFPVTDSGNRYILVAMDYFTKWPEAFAIPDQSAATTAERLVEEMFTRFGAPAELHSDQGRNFESQLMAEVCKRLGVTKTRTTPLHPQSDGLVERFNRTLATQLAILASQHQRDWDRHLPLVLWAYRSAVQESSQLTPAALMFGRELRTPVDLVFGAPPEPEEPSRTREEYYHRLRNRLLVAHDFARKAQASAGVKQKRWYDTRCRGRAFAAGEQVVYRIRMPGRGRLVVLHQDRLAPYRPLATPDAAEPEVSSDTVLPSEPEPSDTPPSATRRPKRHRRPPGHLRDFDVSCGWTAGSSETCDPLGGGNVAAWGLSTGQLGPGSEPLPG
ncbi:hypothetical protein SKAU_G00161870 [Synaphobranchus kaupii]|uniref:Gypsy retrotransposon integrase-like protein 1 n=1 Tax=Synaphobranchus kaupii TaxID=118154 RepID=A0A9Q1FIN2_SYNKA|nr:hypothetical protein SKAU_G00161870 [Synaphobranchus kaupii]